MTIRTLYALSFGLLVGVALASASAAQAQRTLSLTTTSTTAAPTRGGTTSFSYAAPAPSPAAEEYFDPYDACGDEARIESIDFETLDPGDSMVRFDEPWAAGEELFIDLVVSRCARVTSFRYGGIELWGTGGGIDGHSYAVTVASTRTKEDLTEIRLRLVHDTDTLGHGLRKQVLLDITQPKNGRVSTALLHVNWVAEVNGDTEITIVEEDVLNSMIASLYETFGDDARAPIDKNESWFIHDPALEPCTPAHLNDHGCLRVDIVEDLGVRFSIEMKLELAYFCDPVIRAKGAIYHRRVGESFEPVWREDLDVQANIPGLCSLLTGVVPGLIVQEIAEDYVTGIVLDQITPMLTQDAGCGDDCGFAGAPEYHDGEMVVPVRPFLSHVTIDVPYVAKNPAHANFGKRLFIGADQDVLLIPSGSALLCHEQNRSFQDCEAYAVGAVGLENFRSETPSVPNPWELRNTTWLHNAFRQELRDEMILPDRDPETLPALNDNVGMLLVKQDGLPLIRRLSAPCRIPAADVPTTIGFSANDRWDRILGTFDRRVTMVFLDLSPDDVDAIAQCGIVNDSLLETQPTGTTGPVQTGTLDF